MNFINYFINSLVQSKEEEEEEEEKLYNLPSNCFQNICRLKIYRKVLENDVRIKDFLEYDERCILADNYLIAMVFIYFIRSELPVPLYDAQNFFSGLYLAHEMEEDAEELKELIIPWFPGPSCAKKSFLNRIKFLLWEKMHLDCLVRRNECEWIHFIQTPAVPEISLVLRVEMSVRTRPRPSSVFSKKLVMNKTRDWSIWKRARNITYLSNSTQSRALEYCSPKIRQNFFNSNTKVLVREDDIPLQTSDWELDSSSPSV